MFQVRSVFQVLALLLLADAGESQLIQYKKYLNKTILNESLAVENSTFKAQALAFCTIKCNLNSECAAVSFDQQGQCRLFTNQTTTLALRESAASHVYAKGPLKACVDEAFYADGELGRCARRRASGAACRTSDQCLGSLECAGLTCACIAPAHK